MSRRAGYVVLKESGKDPAPSSSPCCRAVKILLILGVAITIPLLWYNLFYTNSTSSDSICEIQLVESIPVGLKYTPNSPVFLSTYESWSWLLSNAKINIDIGSYYWTMRGADVIRHDSAKQGEEIFERLHANGHASLENKKKIRIAQSEPTDKEPDQDTQMLEKNNAAEVVSVNFPKYLGGGVLHTKLWIVDNQHFYLGSANMDWRSLTQVKELGVLGKNCPDLAKDVSKIFEEYWFLGSYPSADIPHQWPQEYNTSYNATNPILINFNSKYTMNAYFSSSPPPLSASGRTHDLDAILDAIDSSVSYINIAVMDYYPVIIYGREPIYWPYIDDALRRAAVERKVSIKLLISWWKYSDKKMDSYLRSLQDLSNNKTGVDLVVRRFIVPVDADQDKIPYARVNHNKYMVTESTAYIGTSNWSGDYFTNTAGIGLVLKDTDGVAPKKTLRNDLQSVFQRDWNSIYAKPFVAEPNTNSD